MSENLQAGVVPGGLEDRTYAPWGKPVESSLRWYFAEPIFEPTQPAAPALLQEALLQSLSAAERKNRRYEDGALPPWVAAWKQAHPEDWAKVEAKLSTEPRPLKKIPKGLELDAPSH